jgi:hypothetical protein
MSVCDHSGRKKVDSTIKDLKLDGEKEREEAGGKKAQTG